MTNSDQTWKLMALARQIDRTGKIPGNLTEEDKDVARQMFSAIIEGKPVAPRIRELIFMAGATIAEDYKEEKDMGEKEFYNPLLSNLQIWKSLDVGDIVLLYDSFEDAAAYTAFIVTDNSFKESIHLKFYNLKTGNVVQFNPGFRHGDKILRINEARNWEIAPY